MIARLAYVYGLDPGRVTTLPMGIVAALIEWAPRLQAEAQLRAAETVLLPWLKNEQRGRTLRRWERAAQVRTSRPEPAPIQEYDPEQARAWFAAHGAKVRTG